MKKRIWNVIMIVTLLFTVSISVKAETVFQDFNSYAEASAERLYELGLFKGVGTDSEGNPDFALGNRATRGEAITMLVRLLGAENDAAAYSAAHPFTDAEWASAYIGYAYAHHISNGISNTEFGTQRTIELSQFLTLILRAMGYDEVDWQNPYPLADQLGLIYADGDFCRADIAVICNSALECPVSGSDATLYETLSQKGAFHQLPPIHASGFGPITAAVTEISISSGDELMEQFVNVMNGRAPRAVVNVPVGTESFYAQELNQQINRFSDIHQLNTSWIEYSGAITVDITYDSAATAMAYLEGKIAAPEDEILQALREAQRVHAQLVDDSMTDYEKVKAFHDYLIEFNTYRQTGNRSHSIVGAFLDGLSVCEGYTEALDLLCYLSNIECVQITGVGYSSGSSESHGWNKVRLDGQWYNVDVTWDDPVSTEPVLRYDYFLISDQKLSADHQWYLYPHWPIADSDYFN